MWKPLKELLPNKKSNLANLTSVSKSNMELVNKFNNYFKKKNVVLLSQQPTLAKNKNKKITVGNALNFVQVGRFMSKIVEKFTQILYFWVLKKTRRFSNHESRLISRSHTFAIIVILDLKIQIKVCGYTDPFFQKLEPKVIDP